LFESLIGSGLGDDLPNLHPLLFRGHGDCSPSESRMVDAAFYGRGIIYNIYLPQCDHM
jgi:hypothetical protein